MQLTDLRINLGEYGDRKGKYTANISFKGQYSSHSLELGEDTSLKLLEVVQHLLIDAGKDLANRIQPAIEAATLPPALPKPEIDGD
mgnify:CR=1 FL=1